MGGGRLLQCSETESKVCINEQAGLHRRDARHLAVTTTLTLVNHPPGASKVDSSAAGSCVGRISVNADGAGCCSRSCFNTPSMPWTLTWAADPVSSGPNLRSQHHALCWGARGVFCPTHTQGLACEQLERFEFWKPAGVICPLDPSGCRGMDQLPQHAWEPNVCTHTTPLAFKPLLLPVRGPPVDQRMRFA